MPLIINAEQVRAIYRTVARKRISLPSFNVENPQTVEAILIAGRAMSRKYSIAHFPAVISFTGHYAERRQLYHYTALRSVEEGYRAASSDIRRLARKGGPFDMLDVMVHFDHGQPVEDREIFRDGREFFASVMFDASTLPLRENAALTRKFVRKYRDAFLIEGAVDEILGSGETGQSYLTTADDADRYVRETGVDLIVCNLGTEHRSTEANRVYNGARAKEIQRRVGSILVLHGSSSLRQSDLRGLGKDGVVKVNVWTNLEKTGGLALAQDTIRHSKALLSRKPPLEILTEAHRCNDVWIPSVAELIGHYLHALGCENLG